MEPFRKIVRTPTAFSPLIVGLLFLLGVIITAIISYANNVNQTKSNEKIAYIPIVATETAEARNTDDTLKITAMATSIPIQTITLTEKPTITQTPTQTPTISPSLTQTPTISPSVTQTISPTSTQTQTQTPDSQYGFWFESKVNNLNVRMNPIKEVSAGPIIHINAGKGLYFDARVINTDECWARVSATTNDATDRELFNHWIDVSCLRFREREKTLEVLSTPVLCDQLQYLLLSTITPTPNKK